MKILVAFLICFLSTTCFAKQTQVFDIYLLRHFEKQSNVDDPGLTEQGKQRAIALSRYLQDQPVIRVFSTRYQRTIQSITPLADSKGLTVTFYDPVKLQQFAEQIKQAGETVVILGHSNTTPQLVRLLGGKAPDLSEKAYGDVFKLTFSGGEPVKTTHFEIVPVAAN